MPTLLFHYPPKKKRWRVTISKESFTLGRSTEADVCVPLPGVSKSHVMVERKGGRFTFRDLGSRNGVILNGFPAREGSLNDGDELEVGGVLVSFYREEPPAHVVPSMRAPERASADVVPSSPEAPPSAEASRPLSDSGPSPPATAETSDEPPAVSDDDLYDPELEALARGLGVPEDQDGGETILLPGKGLPPVEPSGGNPGRVVQDDLSTVDPFAVSSPFPLGKRSGRHVVHRHHAAGPRTLLPAPFLIVLMALAVGAGIALGFITRWIDPPEKEMGRAETPPAPDGETAPGPASEPLTIITQVSKDDAEGMRRLVFRLHLDFLGRPPLRSEVQQLLKLPLDELWLRVTGKASEPVDLPPDSLAAAFPRFLGREAAAGEAASLLQKARGDPRYYLHHLTTSVAYASEDNRRQRSEEQVARSLFVDLLDFVPGESQVADLQRALRAPEAGLPGTVDVLLERSEVGPAPGVAPAAWCRDQFARFLLRPPLPEEESKAVAALGASGGWKAVLRDLATREEYLSY